MQSEYARAGVDYTKINPFKQLMSEVGKRTKGFPVKRWDVLVEPQTHGVSYQHLKNIHCSFVRWMSVLEGLGNKNWIAEWMYKNSGTGRTYYDGVARDLALMAVNDLISHGAMPIAFADEISAGDSEWFDDLKRAKDLADGFYGVCEEVGMCLGAGESASLRYLVKPTEPVDSAPVMSGCATGIIAPATPQRFVTGEKLGVGNRILGITSSGIHANGISLVIKRAMALPNQFMTMMPDGTKTIGEEVLTPTRSYVDLVQKVLDSYATITAFLPGTGDGVRKVAFDKRPFTYRIENWPTFPPIFRFLLDIGVPLEECLKTFNMGIGFYVFVSHGDGQMVRNICQDAGYEIHHLGFVEKGERKVVFEPAGGLELFPPGE